MPHSGGSEGIGYGLAELFIEQEAKVTLASRSKDKLNYAETKLRARFAKARILTCPTDVGSWEQASNGSVSALTFQGTPVPSIGICMSAESF